MKNIRVYFCVVVNHRQFWFLCELKQQPLNFLLFCGLLGDFWCVPDPSAANRFPHSQCTLCWLPHNAKPRGFLKWSAASTSSFIYFINIFHVASISALHVLKITCHTLSGVSILRSVCMWWSFVGPGVFCPLKYAFHTRVFRFYSIRVSFDGKIIRLLGSSLMVIFLML